MKVVILAAGVGKRLGAAGAELPKCLLRIGSETLLERHVRVLQKLRAGPVFTVVGFKKELVERELTTKLPNLRIAPFLNGKNLSGIIRPAQIQGADVTLIENPAYHHGNLLSLWAAHKFVQGEPFLLMDADVFCDERVVRRILETRHANAFLLDRESAEGEEEMLAGARNGRVVRFERGLKARDFDFVGESVGFFKFSAEGSSAMFEQMQEYISRSEVDAHYDFALHDILAKVPFGYEDITGLPWIEIDFAEDVRRAETEILPQIQRAAAARKPPTTAEPSLC